MVQSQARRSLTIAGLAEAGGVGVETIRYYQRRGLLAQPQRTGTAIRRYGIADIQRLLFIRSAQVAGFRLDEIKELIGLDAARDRTKARQMARSRIAELDREIEQLTQARNALEKLAVECGKSRSGPCPIIEAFGRIPSSLS